ncbi:MAG: enoyl-CoA hydratase/isomerase family protein [Deltaproteobacteria bacterium]|jgi:enoyl-CoA hydratase/carnithine racemase|nr:enoyl-CoA hydratase/isomerase family protein [Deltaproteobacteria bacterium]
MPRVNLEAHEDIALLQLNSGVTNAISPELVDDLGKALIGIKDQFKGMVLAGGDKFFCIGLDLPGLLQLGRAEMIDFYVTLNQAVLDLYTLPIPTASAIAGHATAGGAILALSTDFRLIAAGRKFIGLNEVKLGVPVPALADLILRQIVGDRRATEMVFSGEFLEPEQSLEFSLVDAVVSFEDVEKEAVAKISALTAVPTRGLALAKKNRVEAVRSQYDKIRQSDADDFLNCWFDPAVQKLLREAAQKF